MPLEPSESAHNPKPDRPPPSQLETPAAKPARPQASPTTTQPLPSPSGGGGGPARMRWWRFGLGGLGLVLLVVGGGLLYQYLRVQVAIGRLGSNSEDERSRAVEELVVLGG